jgi:RarD protein
MGKNFHRLQIILAMTTFGTLGVFVKNIALSSAEIALWRAVIASIVLILFIVVTKRVSVISSVRPSLSKLFISGIAMGFNWIFLFEAYRYTSVALSTLSYYFAPTLVIIGSALFFKERLQRKQVICFIFSTIGIVLIIGLSGGGSDDMRGILFALAAALLYATVVLCNKATGVVDAIARTWVQFMAAALVLVPYVYMTAGYHIGTLPAKGLALLLIIGIIHTGIMYVFYFSALSHVKGQQAAILSYIDPVMAVLLSVFLLGESISLQQFVGGMIILLSTAANEIEFRRHKSLASFSSR